jgi:predicted dehydrogenase
MAARKRFVQVGLGGRAVMYYPAIAETYSDSCEMVGFCDNNRGRLEMRGKWMREKGIDVKLYDASEFDQMIAELKPDCVIVTSKDCTHDYYVCRALELGCDAITEKPMTTDEEKCQRIIDTQRRTGKRVTVTFNYRYSPPRTQLKDLLMSGVIGDVLSVDFHWMLDTGHGADYFRRWHRNKENSGGLMVHKATHHFDLINWLLSSVPETVYAKGKRNFYTPHQADRYGLVNRTERCLDCPEKPNCKFALDMRNLEGQRELYLDHEKHDGYFRDRCVFSPTIDIEDSMNLVVSYENNVIMSYSLNAYMPWEGHTISINGTKGRIEHRCQESVYISGDGTVPGELQSDGSWTRIFPHFKPPYEVALWEGEGGHGGGDVLLLDHLFKENPAPDKYMHAADQRAGAYSILTGVAANKSMRIGQPVRIDDLVQNIGMPDYPEMPSPDEPITFPKD